jgi:hypothetical protein
MQRDRFACPTVRQYKGWLLLTSGSVAAAVEWRVGGGRDARIAEAVGRGTPPPTFGDRPRQAAEERRDHRLIGRTGGRWTLSESLRALLEESQGAKGEGLSLS